MSKAIGDEAQLVISLIYFDFTVLYDPEDLLSADELVEKVKHHPKYDKWRHLFNQKEITDNSILSNTHVKHAILIHDHVFYQWHKLQNPEIGKIVDIAEAIRFTDSEDRDCSKEWTIFEKKESIYVITHEGEKQTLVVCIEESEMNWEMIQTCLSTAKEYFRKSLSKLLT